MESWPSLEEIIESQALNRKQRIMSVDAATMRDVVELEKEILSLLNILKTQEPGEGVSLNVQSRMNNAKKIMLEILYKRYGDLKIVFLSRKDDKDLCLYSQTMKYQGQKIPKTPTNDLPVGMITIDSITDIGIGFYFESGAKSK